MINIFLVDDHPSIIEGLKAVLEKEKDFKIVGDANDTKSALTGIRKTKPHVVILDIALPGVLGTTIAKEIVSKFKAKVIAFSGYDNLQYIQQIMLAGASGYVLKSCKIEELVTAIRQVEKGRDYFCEKLTHVIVNDYKGRLKNEQKAISILTPREREILQLFCDGMTRHDVADYLSVDVTTISTHRNNIMKKLGAKTTADLTKFYITEGH